jgi:hypothetical protein
MSINKLYNPERINLTETYKLSQKGLRNSYDKKAEKKIITCPFI